MRIGQKQISDTINELFIISVILISFCLPGCSQNSIVSPEEFPTSVSKDGFALSISASDAAGIQMPTPTIDFAVPEDGWAKLTLYNATGYEVKVLFDENVTAGVVSVPFELTNDKGKSLKSGIYVLELKFKDIRELALRYFLTTS